MSILFAQFIKVNEMVHFNSKELTVFFGECSMLHLL